MFDLTKVYLSCFKSVVPILIAQISAILLQIFWLQLLVTQMGLGIDGIAYTAVITALTMVLPIMIYARYVKAETRKSFLLSKEYSIWENWAQYFKLGLPGAFSFCVMLTLFQSMIVLSNHFGPTAAQNMGFLSSLLQVLMRIGNGANQTTTTIVGNLIGANQAALARKMAINIALQSFTICLAISIPLYLCRDRLLDFMYGGEGINITMAKDCMIVVAAINIVWSGF